ncbi:MAG: hypothetical protein RSA79_00430 [Oscillospiraceae bacterium]
MAQKPTKPNYKSRVKILKFLQGAEKRSRVDISNKMKFTKAAVTLIINDMLNENILYEDGTECLDQTVGRGRRKVALSINYNYKFAFGVSIENEKLFVGLSNISGEILDKKLTSIVKKTYIELLEIIVSSIETLIKNNCISEEKVLGIGLTISKDATNIIVGENIMQKLTRIKRDLSHAIDMKITTQSTISASLIAQKLFVQTPIINTLIIRYGEIISSSFLANGKLYSPSKSNAGGFFDMQQDQTGQTTLNSFELFNKNIVEDINHSQDISSALNQKLASDIKTCYTVLKPDYIIAFGTFFDEELALERLNFAVKPTGCPAVSLSIVQESTVFLAGCAIAINDFFYSLGGY